MKARDFKEPINQMCEYIHQDNQKWWNDLKTGEPLERNMGELLMLTVCELAEATEGHRKNLPDEHLPNRPMVEVELADAVIRIMDIAAGFGYDLGGAISDKLLYNLHRQDHTREARLSEHGKKY